MHACPALTGSTVDASGAATTTVAAGACDGFERRDIGNGLTVALPTSAVELSREGTDDTGPIHSYSGATFIVEGVDVELGRQRGSAISGESHMASQELDGFVIFVRTTSTALRECLLASVTYSPSDDVQDR